MSYFALSTEDIIRGYEKTRLNNKRLLQERRLAVYIKIPRIEELDEQATNYHIEAAKRRALGLDNDKTVTNSTKEKIHKINAEKKHLLLDAGYPSDYLEPVYNCMKCMDTGYIEVTDDEHGTLPLIKKCNCYTRQIIDCLYIQSNLKNVLQKENFDTFNLEYYSNERGSQQYSPKENMKNILKCAHEFTEGFQQSKTERGNILIYGETGMGKTFLTNCIAKELLDTGHSVLYLSATELFEKLIADYVMNHKKELEELYKYTYTCELLIIDDLGTELTNNFVLSSLFEIINQRGVCGKSTLVSTNLTMPQLSERYSERIMSRIIADYTVFYMYGDNIRYQKRKNAINSIT